MWQAKIATESELEPKMAELLFDLGSTTKSIPKRHGDMQIAVTHEAWQPAMVEEQAFLGLQAEKMWVREVLITADRQAIMWARSIFPQATIENCGFDFLSLGEKSLGEVLFADTSLQRSEFEFQQLSAAHDYYGDAYEQLDAFGEILSPKVWARRSIFSYYNCPIMLVELML